MVPVISLMSAHYLGSISQMSLWLWLKWCCGGGSDYFDRFVPGGG